MRVPATHSAGPEMFNANVSELVLCGKTWEGRYYHCVQLFAQEVMCFNLNAVMAKFMSDLEGLQD